MLNLAHVFSVRSKVSVWQLYGQNVPICNKRVAVYECGCMMKSATYLSFSKATYFEKREGLGRPQWHFTTYPSVLLTEFFSGFSNLTFQNIKINLNKMDPYLQNMKAKHVWLSMSCCCCCCCFCCCCCCCLGSNSRSLYRHA